MPKATSPFALPPDLEGQKDALTTALQIAQGFALYFVVSDPSRVRPRLMDEMTERLGGKTIQHVAVPPGTRNLLHLFEQTLTDPLPDIVFVYGFENTVSGSAASRPDPILLNLNMTRNNLYAVLPRPVVLWVPLFVLTAVANAAPDFLSVRSGVYTFPMDAEERREMVGAVGSLELFGLLGLGQAQRLERIGEMTQLLSEYRSLPVSVRSRLDEARIMDRLATAHQVIGEYAAAEPLFRTAVEIFRVSLPAGHPNIAASLNNLAVLYHDQGRHAEAESLYREALEIRCAAFPAWHPDIAQSLGNLAGSFYAQGRYTEAEPLLRQALDIRRAVFQATHPDIAASLHNLAALYSAEGRYTEAEPLLREALETVRIALPVGHPNTASSMNSLAELYRAQGRYAEAEPLYHQALEMKRANLGDDHPDTDVVRTNLTQFLAETSRPNAETS
jgi:tetratricopeptide (TPR) repeat protein